MVRKVEIRVSMMMMRRMKITRLQLPPMAKLMKTTTTMAKMEVVSILMIRVILLVMMVVVRECRAHGDGGSDDVGIRSGRERMRLQVKMRKEEMRMLKARMKEKESGECPHIRLDGSPNL